MANNWGPSAPAALGLEWFPVIGATQPIAQNQNGFIQQLRSTAVETIGAMRLAVSSDPANVDPFFMLIDVLPVATAFPVAVGAHSTIRYQPNNDETIGAWTTEAGGTVNLWARIDDPVTYPPTGTDYITLLSSGASAYRASVNSATFPLTARVLRLSVEAVIGLDPAGSNFDPHNVGFTLYHAPSSTVYQMPGNTFTATAFTPNKVLSISCGEINPLTKRPWTAADVRLFDTDWHLRVNASGSGPTGGPIVTAMALKVEYIDPDNRAAVGIYDRPAGALPLVIETTDLVSPNGSGGWAANWAKPGSGDFLFFPRWGRGNMVELGATPANDLAWYNAYQDLGPGGNPPGVVFPPVPGMVGDIIAPSSVGLLSAPFAGDSRRAARIVLRTTAPADSNDSQPYLVRFDTSVLRALHSTQTVGQRMTPNSSQPYLGIRTVIIPPASADGTLTVRVHRVSDDVQMGGAFTITADAVRALPDIGGGARYLEGFLTSAASLTSGVQYELRHVTDVGSADPWILPVPYGAGSSTPTYAAPGGTGTTDCVRLNGLAGSSLTDQDLMATLLIQPSPPATAVATVMAREQTGGGSKCTPEAVDHIVVTWTATALAAAFDRYEIERLEDDAVEVWHSVAVVESSEALATFTDWESPRGLAVKYRVRVVATTAAFSDWTETGWVTAEAYGAELIFTSNGAADLTVVVDTEPEIGTDFPDHEDDTFVPVYGGDGGLVFMNPRDRGLEKSYRLIVKAEDRPCDDYGRPLPDDEVWTPLRRITRAVEIPYVCVLDASGGRQYAHVTLSQGQQVKDNDGALAFWWCKASTRVQQLTPAVVTL